LFLTLDLFSANENSSLRTNFDCFMFLKKLGGFSRAFAGALDAMANTNQSPEAAPTLPAAS